MLAKAITFLGQSAVLICDNGCAQAWGLNSRPTVEVAGRTFYISDNEQRAPDNPGTEEGGHMKPANVENAYKLNRWCVRECERSTLVQSGEEFKLPDWSTRKERT